MTNHEILKASMLDILFENKNKQYGAYTLRKFYDHRMTIALAICISSALLLFYLISISSNTTEAAAEPPKETIMISQVILPPNEPTLPEPELARAQPASTTATVDHQNIQVVPDPQVTTTNVPTVDDIAGATISNTTIVGTPDIGQPIIQQPATGSGGQVDEAITSKPDPFAPVERQPEFPGGREAWIQFLSKHLQVPDELGYGERRTVHVGFQVSASGEVTNFVIKQSAGNSFDREVIRVLKKMPRWKPAIQNGRAVAISFVQPVTFQATEE